MYFSRSLQLTQEELQGLNLGVFAEQGGVLEQHFQEVYSGKFSNEIFALPYFNYLGCGKLDPTEYGALLVLDAYYCYNQVEVLKILKKRMEENKYPCEIINAVDALTIRYMKYCNTFLDSWHLWPYKADDLESSPIPVKIFPTPNMAYYVQHERDCAEKEEPIYGLVALFPCFRLWPFLFWKFGDKVSKDNLYRHWIMENQSSGSSARAVDGLITKYWIEKGNPWDTTAFKEIFKKSINFEKTLFEEAARL